MNKRQKQVQQQFLNNEEEVVKRLKQTYADSLDEITKKAQALQDEINRLDIMAANASDPNERAKILSQKQAKVYQKQYQDALKKQVGSVLDNMQVEEFKTISSYLQKCYEDGFIGTMYDLQGQGVPMAFPLDQEAMVRAVQLDSKISQGLYTRLGEDVADLKKKISSHISRGIATGASWKQTAQQLAATTNIGYNNAVRIARTEGHRIQVQGTMDACTKAKEKGADVVKQWDAALDARTRDSHARVDGEVKELDEKFSNGLMFPGDPSGSAAEVVNCRCALLQRARWALGEGFTKMNNFTKELESFDSPQDYDEFKKGFFSDENRRYMEYVGGMEEKYRTKDFGKVLGSMSDKEYKHYSNLLGSNPVFNANAQQSKTTFVPANTIGEAEEYADRFVSDMKNKFSGNVDYSGIEIEYANEMNRAMTEVFDAYDPQKHLSNIRPFNARDKRFKGTTAEGAYQWGTGDLYYNKAYYKNAKAFGDHLRQYDGLMDTVMPNIDKAIATARNEASRRYAEALKNTGRTNVFPPNAYGSTIHEMGHYLDDQMFRGAFKQSGFDLSASFEKYSGGVSAYATSTQQEYIAESFAAYWKGETDILDPDLVEIFGGLRR